jgi:DNA-binding response OmpR family regulator
VLLIERDLSLGEALSSYLWVAGYDAAHATNLSSALRKLRASEPPAAILVDDLAVGNGWLPHVRSLADGARLILTSFRKQQPVPEISAVLLKPYRAAAVVELLSKLGCAPRVLGPKRT